MRNSKLEDLKTFAAKDCLSIFNDMTEEEVKKHCPPSVQLAWKTGWDISKEIGRQEKEKMKNFKL